MLACHRLAGLAGRESAKPPARPELAANYRSGATRPRTGSVQAGTDTARWHMSRPCGLLAGDCVTDHLCPALDGRRVPTGWRSRCPVCRTERALSITVKGSRILWNCHHAPDCDGADIRAALSALFPACFAARADTPRTRAERE